MSYIKTRNRLMDKCRERDSSGFAFHYGSARPPLELLRLLAIPSLRSSSNPLKKDCDAGRGIRAPLAPTTLGVGQPHRSSFAQTKASSCTLRFGQRAHLLARSAILCSFFLAQAPLQFESPQRRLQCRERDSNPHGNYFPTDFKSEFSQKSKEVSTFPCYHKTFVHQAISRFLWMRIFFRRKATLLKFLSHYCPTFLVKNVIQTGGAKCLWIRDLVLAGTTLLKI